MGEGKILVTGATGQHGGVGGHAVRFLAEAGVLVRALVRTDDQRAHELRREGIETVVGDMLKIDTLRPAMEGVDRVLFCYPIRDGLLEAAINMALVAREASVRAFVDLSLMVAAEGSPSDEAREHWLASKIFDWAEINPIHLMGGFFYENLDFLAGRDMVERGVVEMPFGDGETKLAWVSGMDIARFAAAALLNPEPYVGQAHYVTGPQALTMNEVAEVVSDVFGKPIPYRGDIEMEDWVERLKSHPLANSRIIKHASILAFAFGKTKKSFGKATPVVEDATGTRPVSMRDYLEANKAAWSVPA